jgi:hypothetical protein
MLSIQKHRSRVMAAMFFYIKNGPHATLNMTVSVFVFEMNPQASN